MSGPSAHLSWREMACKDGTPYPEKWRASRAVALAAVFEQLRASVGLPLVVLSCFRTAEHNRLIGGAAASQHVQGRALDLLPPKGWTVLQLAAVAREIVEIRGIGLYPTFLHIDVRPTERRAVWSGSRQFADAVVEAMR